MDRYRARALSRYYPAATVKGGSQRLFTAVLVIAFFPAGISLSAEEPNGSRRFQVVSERNAYYGDLHLMTENAVTAYTRGIRIGPNDAYRFARGETVTVDGQPVTRKSAPLDFLAVTDVAENMGLFKTLYDPSSPFSQSEIGKQFLDPATRGKAFSKVFELMFTGRGREAALLGLDPEVVQ